METSNTGQTLNIKCETVLYNKDSPSTVQKPTPPHTGVGYDLGTPLSKGGVYSPLFGPSWNETPPHQGFPNFNLLMKALFFQR